MAELADALAAPARVSFDGVEYILSPLTLGDMAEGERWAEEWATSRTEKRIALREKHGATPEQKQAMLDALFAEIDSGRAAARAASTFEGICFSLWSSLRHKHPELTREKAAAILQFAGMEAMQERLDRISGLADAPGEGDGKNEVRGETTKEGGAGASTGGESSATSSASTA